MDIAKAIEKRIGLKKQVVTSKGLEGLKVIDTSKMNNKEQKRCIDGLWDEIIKNDK